MLSLQTAFSQFTINAEIRPRAELRDGYKQMVSTNPEPAYLISQRSRITMGFANENIITKFSFQDVRVWGDEKFKTDNATLGLKEAWVDMKLCDSLWLKMGRQELSFDNERLFSANNWNQVGMSHDGLLLHGKYNTWTFDMGGAFNQISDATLWGTDYSLLSASNYKALGFLWLSKKIGDLKITATGITDGYQKTLTKSTTYFRITSGGSLIYSGGHIKSSARGYWQGGRNLSGVKINSWLAQADFAYTFFNKLSILLGFEHWSGQYTDAQKEDNRFNLLYGTTHKFNGSLDYYTSADDVFGMGLNDLYLNIMYKWNKKLELRGDLHYFNSDKDYYYKSGIRNDFGKYLGTEIDLSVNWSLYEYININAGYSFMLPSAPFKVAQFVNTGVEYNTSRIPQWAFVMLTFNAELFRFTKEKK